MSRADAMSRGHPFRITKAHPTLSCIILNAGIQRTIDFTQQQQPSTSPPSSSHYASIAAKATAEVTTNYLSPLLTAAAFLPHLLSLAPRPAALIPVTSGLALVPLPRCPSYSASKAALHSLCWSLRAQLAAASSFSPSSPAAGRHVRVVEIMPPAVQTELHELQPELVAAGQAHIGMPLADYIDETWASLERWDSDEVEIMVAQVRGDYGHLEDEKRIAFEQLREKIKALRGPA